MTSAGQVFEEAVREYADKVAENFSLPVDADPEDQLKPESTEGGRRVSVLKRQEGAPVLLG